MVWRIRDRLVSGRPDGYRSEGIAILPGLFPLQLDRLTWDKRPEALNAHVAEMGPATTRSLGRVDYSPPLLIQPEPDDPLRAHQTRIAPIRSVVPHADLLWVGQVSPRYPVAGSMPARKSLITVWWSSVERGQESWSETVELNP